MGTWPFRPAQNAGMICPPQGLYQGAALLLKLHWLPRLNGRQCAGETVDPRGVVRGGNTFSELRAVGLWSIPPAGVTQYSCPTLR